MLQSLSGVAIRRVFWGDCYRTEQMTIKIHVPESTSADVIDKIVECLNQLSATPELVYSFLVTTEPMEDFRAAIKLIRQAPNRFKAKEESIPMFPN